MASFAMMRDGVSMAQNISTSQPSGKMTEGFGRLYSSANQLPPQVYCGSPAQGRQQLDGSTVVYCGVPGVHSVPQKHWLEYSTPAKSYCIESQNSMQFDGVLFARTVVFTFLRIREPLSWLHPVGAHPEGSGARTDAGVAQRVGVEEVGSATMKSEINNSAADAMGNTCAG